jgi:hypothetical protein
VQTKVTELYAVFSHLFPGILTTSGHRLRHRSSPPIAESFSWSKSRRWIYRCKSKRYTLHVDESFRTDLWPLDPVHPD